MDGQNSNGQACCVNSMTFADEHLRPAYFGITCGDNPGEDDFFTNVVLADPRTINTSGTKSSVEIITSMSMTYNPADNLKDSEDFELLVVFGDPHKGKAKIKCKRD